MYLVADFSEVSLKTNEIGLPLHDGLMQQFLLLLQLRRCPYGKEKGDINDLLLCII
jgi:hypothetical protein